MATPFAQRAASIVASGTGTCRAPTVGITGWFPSGGCVARITTRARRNMRQRFCNRIGKTETAIVAIRAEAQSTRVVHLCRLECRKIKVARIALRTGWDVIDRFAQCSTTVMAIRTIPNGSSIVTERGQSPTAGGCVTAIALCARAYVSEGFSQCIAIDECPAMARRTLTTHTQMIHRNRNPSGEAIDVTGVTLAGDRNVVHRFAQGIGKAEGTAMTGRTLSRRPTVVHPRRLETDKVVVATVALRTARDMRGRLAQGSRAVVAARTGSCRRRRVNIADRCPCAG